MLNRCSHSCRLFKHRIFMLKAVAVEDMLVYNYAKCLDANKVFVSSIPCVTAHFIEDQSSKVVSLKVGCSSAFSTSARAGNLQSLSEQQCLAISCQVLRNRRTLTAGGRCWQQADTPSACSTDPTPPGKSPSIAVRCRTAKHYTARQRMSRCQEWHRSGSLLITEACCSTRWVH